MINGLVHWIAQNFPNIYNLGWTGDTGWGTSILQIIYTFIFFYKIFIHPAWSLPFCLPDS